MPAEPARSRESLQGRVAVVTGAAKRLGRAIALRLAEEGADVVVHYRDSAEEAQGVVGEIASMGRRAIALPADLSSVAGIKGLFEEVSRQFGQLDILVNNAANFLPASLESATEELWDASLDANVKGPFFCAQAAAPLLKKSRGTIINFGDVGGLLAWPSYIPHCVSKAGVVMLTRCLAKALAPEVRVNAIAPGTIALPGNAPEWEAEYIGRTPLGRAGTAAEVAEAVVFLIHASFMTGQVLVLDGGRTL